MIPVAGTLPFFLRVQAKSRAAYSAAQKMHHGRFCENRIRYAAFWPGHAKRSLILPARSSCANQNWTLMSLIHSRKERRTPIAASHGPGSKPSAPLSGIARPLPQSPLCSTVPKPGYEPSASLALASTLALSLALYFRLRGFVLNLYPQHGHQSPSHLMKISQIWHRLWPDAYLPVPTGF